MVIVVVVGECMNKITVWIANYGEKKYGYILTNHSLYKYNSAMKDFMHRYKFQGDYRLRYVFQRQFTDLIRKCGSDVIIPIPVNSRTMQTRGFNQVSGLIENSISIKHLLLAKSTVKSVPQSLKNRQERLKTQQPFLIHHPDFIMNKSVTLVDDIYTTGRTLYHAANLCREAGCRVINSVTLAS